MTPDAAARQLMTAIDRALPDLRAIDDRSSMTRTGDERWSAREELGHLIDSAVNNHRRVVLGRLQQRLDFEGYDGDAWVEAHAYNDVPWRDIVDLWAAMNRQLARAVARVPPEVFTLAHANHTMGTIGSRTYAPGQSASLADLVGDYIDHLEHHLEGIRKTVATVRESPPPRS